MHHATVQIERTLPGRKHALDRAQDAVEAHQNCSSCSSVSFLQGEARHGEGLLRQQGPSAGRDFGLRPGAEQSPGIVETSAQAWHKVLQARQRVPNQRLWLSSRPAVLEIFPKRLIGGWDGDWQGLAKAQEPLEDGVRGLQVPLHNARLELQGSQGAGFFSRLLPLLPRPAAEHYGCHHLLGASAGLGSDRTYTQNGCVDEVSRSAFKRMRTERSFFDCDLPLQATAIDT